MTDITTPYGATTIGENATLEGTIDVLSAVAERDWQVGSTVAGAAVKHLRAMQSEAATYRQVIISRESALTVAEGLQVAAEVEARTAKQDAARWQQSFDTLGNEFIAFKTRVRNAAIGTQEGHSGHISLEALNEWLGNLSLDPVEMEYICTGTWRGIEMPRATVTATSDSEAENKYREALGEGALNTALRLHGEVSDSDAVTFDSNNMDEETDDDDGFDADDVDVEVEAVD